ncbi:hypothetical protein F441_04439, partial [Phytophthora nicotianae CJ01A1]
HARRKTNHTDDMDKFHDRIEEINELVRELEAGNIETSIQ